jgi:hypothetical protein
VPLQATGQNDIEVGLCRAIDAVKDLPPPVILERSEGSRRGSRMTGTGNGFYCLYVLLCTLEVSPLTTFGRDDNADIKDYTVYNHLWQMRKGGLINRNESHL